MPSLCWTNTRRARARARAQASQISRDWQRPQTARALWTAQTSTLSLACELPKNAHYLQPRSLASLPRRFDYPRSAREDAFPPLAVSPRCQSCRFVKKVRGCDWNESESLRDSARLVTRARMSERAKCMTRRESVTELKRHAPVTLVRWPWNIDPIQRDKEGAVKAMEERRGTCFRESRSARCAPCQGYASLARIVVRSRLLDACVCRRVSLWRNRKRPKCELRAIGNRRSALTASRRKYRFVVPLSLFGRIECFVNHVKS